MEDHVRYTLEKGIAYAHGGESRDATFIEINEPTSKNLAEQAVLRQAMVQAIRAYDPGDNPEPTGQAQEGDDEPKDEGISAVEVLGILSASPVALGTVYSAAKTVLLSRGICLVDGEEKLTQTLFDKFTARDAEMLIGTFIASFILAS